METELNVSTSQRRRKCLTSEEKRERKRVANQKYYAKKKGANANVVSIQNPIESVDEVQIGTTFQSPPNVMEGENAILTARNYVGCADEACPNLDVDIEVDHVESAGDSPSQIEGICGSSIGTPLTSYTNNSSYLDSDMSLLDALVGEEGQTSARAKEHRRIKNQKHYAKRQAFSEAHRQVTFMADSVEDRNEFGGIYCPKWNQAKELLYTWLEYCKEFFKNAKACANCGKFVFGGKYSMHYGKFVVYVCYVVANILLSSYIILFSMFLESCHFIYMCLECYSMILNMCEFHTTYVFLYNCIVAI
jgi:hypothetical protein